MRSLRRGRARRLASLSAALLLGGCDTAARHYIHEQPLGGPHATAILLRVTDPPGGPARAARLAEAEIAPFGGPARRLAPAAAGSELGVAPSHAAGTEGWVNLPIGLGRHVLRLHPSGTTGAEGERRFEFTIPGTPGVHYIGTFRRDCPTAAGRGCRIAPEVADETEAATAMLARETPAAGPPLRALAQPYPAVLGALGLAPPATATLRVNAAAWREAVNWTALSDAERPRPQRGQDGPRSEGWPQEGATLRSVAGLDLSGGGSAAGLIVLPAAVVVALPIALVIHGITVDVQRRRAEDAAREQAENTAALQSARERWGACLGGIAGALEPAAVERDLRASALQAPQGAPWQAELARVLLRPCGAAGENRYGLEVMSRWTARAGGGAFDAAYSRAVAGATEDRRLRHPRRPPWELPVASEAACRPLEEWCGQEGAARLRAEVLRGMTEARDAIAAGR